MTTSSTTKHLTRTQIRYALFRCKAGTSDAAQEAILESYIPQLLEFGLDRSDFAVEWDVDPKDLTQIVTGKIARNMNKEKSLFSSSGELKE